MIIYILLSSIIFLLICFSFFGIYNFIYSIASIFKQKIKKVVSLQNAKVAVVIVSFNEKKVLFDTIKACEQLTYKNKIIIIGDDSNDKDSIMFLQNLVKEKQLTLREYSEHSEHSEDSKNSEHSEKKTNSNSLVYESDDFVVFHRIKNIGFKAGNLKAMESYLKERGIDYMYLLDSDWHPQVDAIERCLEVIEAEDDIAFVQTKRLSHYGPFDHFMRSIAIVEEACYFVDLPGRQNMGDMILFSGCCALFKLSYLYEVGGFQTGHLTEDLDISNRFYLNGYKGVYLEEVENVGEVPPTYRAFRKQQERWAIGTAKSFKDYFFRIIKNKKMSFKTKCGLLRQNAYYSSIIITELSILISTIFIVLYYFRTSLHLEDQFSSELLIILQQYLVPIMLVLLFSSILPLIVYIFKKRDWPNFIYILPACWFPLSVTHTYLIGNIKGFTNIPSNWYLTPKTNRQKVKITTVRDWRIQFVNFLTLILLAYTYFMSYHLSSEIFVYSLPYAILWIPALVIGVIKS
ncbi:MAG: glycosyltransferase [Oligoflexia bacterium]|nr:glycosyltransferase [Oligoflexia bacterium]